MAANRIYIQVDFQQQGAVAAVNQLNQAIGQIGPKTQQASQQASQGVSSLQLTINNAQKSVQSLSTLGAGLAGLGMQQFAKYTLEAAAALDTQRKTLELWENSAFLAQSRFNQFLDMSKESGVALEPALEVFSRLRGAGVDAGEATKMIQGFGRALGQMGRGGEDLKGVMEQVAQSVSKGGGIMREDLKFIQQYVPQVTAILKSLYGTTVTEELQKKPDDAMTMWRKVTERMLEMKAATPGIQKMMEQFWQSMRLGAAAFGKTLAEDLQPKMAAFQQSVKDMVKWWEDLDPTTRKIIVKLGEAAAGFVALAGAIKTIGFALEGVAAILTANPVLLALLAAGGTMYALSQVPGVANLAKSPLSPLVQGQERVRQFGEVQQSPLSPIGQGQERLRQLGEFLFPGQPGYKPPVPGVPQQGYVKPPAVVTKAPHVPTKEELAAAESIAKWGEQAREKVHEQGIAAGGDFMKAFAAGMKKTDPLQDLNARMAAIAADRQREWEALITRPGKGGKPQYLPEAVQKQLRPEFDRETRIKQQTEWLKWRQEQEKESDAYLKKLATDQEEIRTLGMEQQTKAYADMLSTNAEMDATYQDEKLKNEKEALDKWKDQQLEALQSVGHETLQQNIALTQQRLAVEQEYVDKALDINLRLLKLDKDRAVFQLETQRLMANMAENDPTYLRAKQSLEDLYTLRKQTLETGAADDREKNRLKALHDQQKLIRDEMQKTFDFFQHMAEGVFDSLTTKSKSVWQSLADFWKTTILTIIKSIFTSVIAGSMTRLLFGQPMNQTTSARTGGALPGILSGGSGAGIFGRIFGGGGGSGGGGGTGGGGGIIPWIPPQASGVGAMPMDMPGPVVSGGASGGGGGGIFGRIRGWIGGSGGGFGGGGGGGTFGGGGGGGIFSGASGSNPMIMYNQTPAGGAGGDWSLVPGAIGVYQNTKTGQLGYPAAAGQQGQDMLTKLLGGKFGGTGSSLANQMMGGIGITQLLGGWNQKGLAGNINRTMGATMATYGLIGKLPIAGHTLGLTGSLGVGLAVNGLRQGGFLGLAQTTAGGALIGARFGGPLGAAIGAGIGAIAGTIRLFIKGAKEKYKAKIKEIYGIDVQSDGILQQIMDIVKQNYGGDMNVGLYSPQVREMIQMYAQTQGVTATGIGRPMYPVSWSLSGGANTLQPVYSGGSMVSNPYVGTTTTQQNATFVQLNPQQANSLFEGRVVQVMQNNPGTVADASTSAMEPTYRRTREQSSLMEPMTMMS